MSLANENDSSKFLLRAVNILLKTINEEPIDSEEDFDAIKEAQNAADTLEEVKKAVLSEEWDVCYDEGYTFPVDSEGYIPVPANVLDIYQDGGNVIMRDWRLYDKTAQSAKFEEAQSMNVVWNLDFNSLPHPLRYYITVRAARIFQDREVTDGTMHTFTEEDERKALTAARRSEARSTSANMLDTFDYPASAYDERRGL